MTRNHEQAILALECVRLAQPMSRREDPDMLVKISRTLLDFVCGTENEAQSPWQPIATAPRDGTELLLSNGKRVWVGYWLEEAVYSFGKLVRERNGWRSYLAPEPTLWMPIPALPLETDQAGA